MTLHIMVQIIGFISQLLFKHSHTHTVFHNIKYEPIHNSVVKLKLSVSPFGFMFQHLGVFPLKTVLQHKN